MEVVMKCRYLQLFKTLLTRVKHEVSQGPYTMGMFVKGWNGLRHVSIKYRDKTKCQHNGQTITTFAFFLVAISLPQLGTPRFIKDHLCGDAS